MSRENTTFHVCHNTQAAGDGKTILGAILVGGIALAIADMFSPSDHSRSGNATDYDPIRETRKSMREYH